jgi:hypothetical protein
VLAALARLSPAHGEGQTALIGFFDVVDGTLVQKRVEKERSRAAEFPKSAAKQARKVPQAVAS